MNYFEIYKDVWNFHKKYQQIQSTDEYWEAVINESNQISKKYDNCKFVRALLLAIVDELERVYKELKQDADTTV